MNMQDTEEKVIKETTTVAAPVERVVKTTKVRSEPEIRTEAPQQVFDKKKTIFRTYQIVWYILAVLEALLGMRVLLKLLGASISSGFTQFIYFLSDPFALPFQGIVRAIMSEGSVIEWSTVIAMIVYWFIALGIVELFRLIKPVTPKEVEESV